MTTGKIVRLNHLFGPDGKTVIAALDHGIAGITPLAGLTDPSVLIPKVIASGADAILTTPGIASRYAGMFGHTGLILRIDGGPSSLTGQWEKMQLMVSVADALRLGADAVIMMGIVGAEGESETLANMGRVAAECQKWGVPLIAEMLPGGITAKEVSIEQIAIAARLGAELGADVIKIRYLGPTEAFRQVTDCCYQPIVILGGSKQTLEKLEAEVSDALSAGAVGVAVGRNIWQDPDPGLVTHRLFQRVHG